MLVQCLLGGVLGMLYASLTFKRCGMWLINNAYTPAEAPINESSGCKYRVANEPEIPPITYIVATFQWPCSVSKQKAISSCKWKEQ